MAKDHSRFESWQEIPELLSRVDMLIEWTDWQALSYNDKVDTLADIHTELNRIHPFREGNGRTTRIVMENLAKIHGIAVDWQDAVPALHSASAISMQFPPLSEDSVLPLRLIWDQISAPLPNEQQDQKDFHKAQEMVKDIMGGTGIDFSLESSSQISYELDQNNQVDSFDKHSPEL
ncbi:hypothetical protein CP162_08515 [Corynebacterium pseudotuberculosis Cp162]|nr:hypothetical protein CP162_08515 [Corynebacterium pseudotuberculosis Cp162]